MRAVRVHEFGGELRLDDVPDPEPGPAEVLFDVRYAGVNPLDVWMTQGTVAEGSQPLPFVPGGEGSGEINGRPALVHGYGLGVRRDGLYRERAVVPEEAVTYLPDGVALEAAAGMCVAGATAWRLVHEVTKMDANDRVVVLGASGGVGSLLIQVAKGTGAQVWGQTSSADKREFVEGLGADRAIVADAESLVESVADLSPTVVMDPLGDGYTTAGIAALEPFGRLALFGTSAGTEASVDLRALYRKGIALLTYSGTVQPPGRSKEAREKVLGELAAGRLRVTIDSIMPLERAGDAHRRILEKQVRGKILLSVRE